MNPDYLSYTLTKAALQKAQPSRSLRRLRRSCAWSGWRRA
jgi:hypothetical protein